MVFFIYFLKISRTINIGLHISINRSMVPTIVYYTDAKGSVFSDSGSEEGQED